MKQNLIDKVIKKLISMLESVGSMINSVPSREENARVRQSPLMKAKMWEKDETKKAPVRKTSVKTTSRRKGKRDTATQVFNHPRKDFHA